MIGFMENHPVMGGGTGASCLTLGTRGADEGTSVNVVFGSLMVFSRYFRSPIRLGHCLRYKHLES